MRDYNWCVIVAAHQPIFMPWPGLFCKMLRADVLVLLDNVQLPRGASWMTRNRLKSEQGEVWLRVPVKRKHLGLQSIREVEIVEETAWRRKHLRTLREKYSNAPFATDFLPEIESIYSLQHTRLADLNITLIRALAKLLNLNPHILLQSELGISDKGSDLLISICRRLNADAHLILPPVKKYLDIEKFKQAGIDLRFLSFHPPVYPQLWGAFRFNLSAVDLLFNCGGAKSLEILGRSG